MKVILVLLMLTIFLSPVFASDEVLQTFLDDLHRAQPDKRLSVISQFASVCKPTILYAMIKDLRSQRDDSRFCVYSMVVLQLNRGECTTILKGIESSDKWNADDKKWAEEFLTDMSNPPSQ